MCYQLATYFVRTDTDDYPQEAACSIHLAAAVAEALRINPAKVCTVQFHVPTSDHDTCRVPR